MQIRCRFNADFSWEGPGSAKKDGSESLNYIYHHYEPSNSDLAIGIDLEWERGNLQGYYVEVDNIQGYYVEVDNFQGYYVEVDNLQGYYVEVDNLQGYYVDVDNLQGFYVEVDNLQCY